MNQLKKVFFPLFLCTFLFLSTVLPVAAAGDGNMDGGGGNMGSGTSTDVWRGQDGVRVTVVTSDGAVVSTPFDLSNSSISDQVINFGKICKLSYSSGTALTPSGSYSCSKPGIALPRIISGTSSKANMEAIRRYFCSEYAAQMVSAKTGIAYDDLVSGAYKLVVEPIAYFVHGGRNYAMTATEAALYNQKSGGTLRKRMPSLTHQNLPLAIFLEEADLGYPAWTGTVSGKVTDEEILSALGIGIVSYRGLPESDPSLEAVDYIYRVNTDVITSVTLTTPVEINPDDPAEVTFHINGNDYTVTNIVIPAGSSQIVWTKWHTPSEPTELTITVSVEGASTAQTSFTAKVISLDENPPPDPLATDTNPFFSSSALPDNPEKRSASWSVWSAYWESDWRWVADWEWVPSGHSSSCPSNCSQSHGSWVDNGKWKDFGKYIFESNSYSAALTGSMEIHPDDIVPTAQGDVMKSGYGVKETASASLSVSAPETHYTAVQTAVSYFSEFSYEDYWRLLQPAFRNSLTTDFSFQPNEYSTYNRNVHFSPVWYPDNVPYTVYTYIIDAWTPVGMLSLNVSDSIQIQGSLYDDWYSKRE